MSQQFLTLNDGIKMPIMGFGTAIGDLMPDYDSTLKIIETSLEVGYRHIDTARLYGTEKIIGDALENKIKQGLVKREDVFISTKLWTTHNNKEDVVAGLKQSLADLQVDYVDMFLIHWPTAINYKPGPGEILLPLDEKFQIDRQYFTDTDYLQTWEGMEECYNLGLAKAIGVSNFNSKQLQRLLDSCKIKPALLQIESNPHMTNTKLMQFCQSNGVAVMAFSPLGGNYRTFDPTRSADQPSIYTDPVIAEIAKTHNITPAQVSLRFQIQRNMAVTTRSSNPDRMKESLQALDVKISDDDIEKIESGNKNFRQCDFFQGHVHYPFGEEF